jgi:hypothetical protein
MEHAKANAPDEQSAKKGLPMVCGFKREIRDDKHIILTKTPHKLQECPTEIWQRIEALNH